MADFSICWDDMVRFRWTYWTYLTTLWTLLFETSTTRAVRYVTTVLQTCIQRHVFPVLFAISYIVNTTAHLSVRFPVTSVYSPVQWNSTLNQLNPVHSFSVCIEREFYMIDTRFSALHVFITLSTIKHDQQLFFTLTEPTTNKNDFHHHIDLDAGSIMPRFVSGKITCGVVFYDMKIYVCKSVCDF